MEDEHDACSLFKTDECTFAYIKHINVYMVATMRKNSNIACPNDADSPKLKTSLVTPTAC